MSPEEAKEFGLIDKVLAQVPKPGHDDSDVSPPTEKSDWFMTTTHCKEKQIVINQSKQIIKIF